MKEDVAMIQGIRRTDGSTETPGGHPLPLTGKPLTDTPVVVRKAGVPLKEYPEVCIPAQEELGGIEIARDLVDELLKNIEDQGGEGRQGYQY